MYLHMISAIISHFCEVIKMHKTFTFVVFRNVLTKYSWTGVSRTGSEKYPFFKLAQILGMYIFIER